MTDRALRVRTPAARFGAAKALGWTLAAALAVVASGAAERAAIAGGAEAEAASETGEALPDQPDVPLKPGVHHARFRYALNGEERPMAVGVYLPEKVAHIEGEVKLPMVVHLAGVGERGLERKRLYSNGPIADMARHPSLKDHLEFIVLAPQCPRDQRWRSEGMPEYVADSIRMATELLPVDPDRVYLTGLSMGGTGTWHVARHAPELFAAIAPMCGRSHDPDQTAERIAGLPTWIIVGGSDREPFTEGAERMYDALKDADAHVRMTVVPGVGHGVWARFYPKPEFYQWLLQHRRGGKVHDLHTDSRLLRIAYLPSPDPAREKFERRLAKRFDEFAPYWHIDGCGRSDRVGLQGEALGREKVFVTRPLSRHVPCRLMFTAKLDKGERATLRIVVGHAPDGRYRLTVNLGNRPAIERVIDGDATEDGWAEFSVDLSGHAGRRLPIQVVHEPLADSDSHAYWAKVAVERGGATGR